ncbi:MAG: helix-turn-helix transcriptional regulator [Desulfuromonadales bacterium]
MRKQSTEKLEARFMGTPENIQRLRLAARRYNVVDVTADDPKKAVKDGNYTIEEVFPELLDNRAGVILRGYRSREELTQKKLSEMTGIPQRHISELEHGKRQAGKEWAKKLGAALNCDYRRFL